MGRSQGFAIVVLLLAWQGATTAAVRPLTRPLRLSFGSVVAAVQDRINNQKKLNDADPGSKTVDRDYRSHEVTGSVLLQDGKYSFASGLRKGYPAQGSYVDSAHTRSNFGILHVRTSPAFSDAEQMYAAGYLEGWLTAERIYDHFFNMRAFFNMSTDKPIQWLLDQDAWAREQAATNDSDLWAATGLVLTQHEGLIAGYNDRAADKGLEFRAAGKLQGSRRRLPPLSKAHLLMVTSVGDLGDLIPALESDKQPAWDAMDPAELMGAIAQRGKCSAMVKVTGDLSDLLMSHSSWYTYAAMQRIYKHYYFALHHPAIASQCASFSSYAGELSSDDDFYVLDSGLVLLQTTNNVYNTSLYDLLTPASITSWQRVRVANLLAQDGASWAALIRQHNSGTYNNQYMVVDLNKFQPGRELQAGLLWVVEQLPGLTAAADATQTLERGYWPSYNVPFFQEVYEAAGYPEFRQRHAARGAEFETVVAGLSYQLAPRAKIFRRDEGDAADLDSLKSLMRSNDWAADSYSGGSPLGAICGRGDIDPKRPALYGCYDTKVTSYRLASQRTAAAVNGPTREGGLPPFQWSSQHTKLAHIGQPQKYDFDFELMRPWE